MSKLQRRIYSALLRLHPAAFRHQFGRDMARDCEDAIRDRGFAALITDAFVSLARQWKSRALAGPEPEMDPAVAGHPFLSGRYIVVTHSSSLTAFDLVSASILSILLLLTIGYAASVPNRRTLANLQTITVNHDGGVVTPGNAPARTGADIAGHREAAGDGGLIAPGSGTPHYKGVVHLSRAVAPPVWRQHASGGPRATEPLLSALRQFTLISIIVWITSLLLRRVPGAGRRVAVAALGLLSIAASVAFGQTPLPPAQVTPAPPPATTPTEPSPSFEVATIKPWDGNGFASPLRVYIQSAFGIHPNSVGRLIGPDWIDNAKYVIQGKPSGELRDAMQKMTAEDRAQQMRLMQQSLLADRFKLKVHVETREMPVYELVPAKDGSKLKENSDPSKGNAVMRKGAQASQIKGTALPMARLINFLMSADETGGRTVIDKTGLTGLYDVQLNWAPLTAAPGVGSSPTDTETPSLFVALQEQLGLKLVPSKGPEQVIVIDHIEKPSEN